MTTRPMSERNVYKQTKQNKNCETGEQEMKFEFFK